MTRTITGTILLLVLALVVAAGCTTAIQVPTMTPAATTAMGTAAPTATLTQAQQMQLGMELFGAVCVCHPTGQLGAPSVAQVASLPTTTIDQAVRSGRGAMPMWDQTQLSQDWLTLITNYIASTTSGTPMAGATTSGTPTAAATTTSTY